MLDFVRDGDVLVVESISRFARSKRDLLSIVDTLREKCVDLVSLKERVDATPTSWGVWTNRNGSPLKLEGTVIPNI